MQLYVAVDLLKKYVKFAVDFITENEPTANGPDETEFFEDARIDSQNFLADYFQLTLLFDQH